MAKENTTAFLLLNLNRTLCVTLSLPGACNSVDVYRLTSSGLAVPNSDLVLNAPAIALNGEALQLPVSVAGSLPTPNAHQGVCGGAVEVGPLTAQMALVTS